MKGAVTKPGDPRRFYDAITGERVYTKRQHRRIHRALMGHVGAERRRLRIVRWTLRFHLAKIWVRQAVLRLRIACRTPIRF